MKNYKNFNRHETFNKNWFNIFSDVKKDICDWADFDEVEISTLKNQLFGIWDGFLYDGLIERAENKGVPKFLVYRLERVVNMINKHMENGGELTEEEANSLQF